MRKIFLLLFFVPVVSFASFDVSDSSNLTIAKDNLSSINNILMALERDVYWPQFQMFQSWNSALSNLRISDLPTLSNQNTIKNILQAIQLGQISVSDLSNMDLARDSSLSYILSAVQDLPVGSIDSKLDQLTDIYYKLDEIAKDGTLSSLNDSFGIFQNEFGNFVTEVESSLSGLATESTLSSVDSKLDGLATESTLSEVNLKLDNLATEQTLQDVASFLSDASIDLGYLGGIYTLLDQIALNVPGFNAELFDKFLYNFSEYDFATETTLQAVLSAIENMSGSSDIDVSKLAQEETLSYLSEFIRRSDFQPASHSYVDIDVASNSAPHVVDLDYSSSDFFTAAIKLVSDGNQIAAAQTRFLKHILELMPKQKDTSAEESRISSQIDDASSQMDSVRQSFDFTSSVKFRDGSSNYFKYDSLFSSLPGSDSLPTIISIKLPSFSDYSTDHYFEIETVHLSGFFEVSRACFTVLYFVLISGFVWFLFRLFIPVMLRFSKLLATVFNW